VVIGIGVGGTEGKANPLAVTGTLEVHGLGFGRGVLRKRGALRQQGAEGRDQNGVRREPWP